MCNLDSRYKFTNDLCFSMIMEECPQLTKQLLELLLGKKIAKLKALDTQKTVVKRLDSRGVRFDVYTEDEDGKVFNVEMQVRNKSDLAKRSRYYHSMLDLNQLGRGNDYINLKETYVIFICKDSLGEDMNLPVYTYRYRCDEDFSNTLDDGTITMLVNSHGDDTGLSDEMKAFLKYIRTGELSGSDDNLVHQLQAEVEYARTERRWEDTYMTLDEIVQDAVNAASATAKAEGILESLISLVKDNLITIEEAAKRAGLPIEDFRKLIK